MGQTFQKSVDEYRGSANVTWRRLAVAYHSFNNAWLKGPVEGPLCKMLSSGPFPILTAAYLFAEVVDLDLIPIGLELTFRVYL